MREEQKTISSSEALFTHAPNASLNRIPDGANHCYYVYHGTDVADRASAARRPPPRQRVVDLMRMTFDVAGTPSEFRRSRMTGRAELQVGREIVRLQRWLQLSTQVDLTTKRRWERRVGDHDIVITKVRPWLFAAWRPNTFVISIDDEVVGEAMAK